MTSSTVSSATVSGVVITSGDTLTLVSGGVANAATVSSGGELSVGIGGGTHVASAVGGGEIVVDFDGVISGTMLLGSSGVSDISYAQAVVLSGGFAFGTMVGSAAQLIISGGYISGVTVQDGGSVIVEGSVEEMYDVTVTGSGPAGGGSTAPSTMIVTSSGDASGATIGAGGLLIASAHGTVKDATIGSGGIVQVRSGGTVIGSGSHGSLIDVGPHGAWSGVIMGSAVVSSAGSATGFFLHGGQMDVQSGGWLGADTQNAGGTVRISSGAKDRGAEIYRTGNETVYAGGSAVSNEIFTGGLLTLSGGSATWAEVEEGGEIIVLSGGLTMGLTLDSYVNGSKVGGGIGLLSSGAIAKNTTIYEKGNMTVRGGTMSKFDVSHGGILTISAGGKATAGTIYNGPTRPGVKPTLVTVSSGGQISDTSVASHGTLDIGSSGTAQDISVSRGGFLQLETGAHASNVQVLSGGEIVFAGGAVTGLTAAKGAIEGVAAGVKVSGLTIGSGVTLVVSSGAGAAGTKLNGGTEVVSAGGTMTGVTTFRRNATLATAAAGKTALSISGFSATDTLDLTAFQFDASEKLRFVESKDKTKGTLTITSGTSRATITLFGQYVAAGFHLAADAAGGTAITYSTSAHSTTNTLAASHG